MVYVTEGIKGGSGKSTIANHLAERWHKGYKKSYVLDGDEMRKGLSNNLGFKSYERIENIRRAAEVTKMIYNLGYSVFVDILAD